MTSIKLVFTLTVPANSSLYLGEMQAKREDANFRQGETAAQFTARTEQALAQAKALSVGISGNLAELNRLMTIASPTMTWMEALQFSIDCMQQHHGPVLPEPVV
jgi:hypothetical protein